MSPRALLDPRVVVLAAVVVVYAVFFLEVGQCEYSLVNDLRPYQVGMPEEHLIVPVEPHLLGQSQGWPQKMLDTLFDPFSEQAWLYRPLPDFMEWGLSSLFRGSPGDWHLVIAALRLLTILLTYRLLAALGSGVEGRALGTLYVAFFPAVPEIQVTYAEIWLLPSLLLTLLAFTHVRKLPEDGRLAGRSALAAVLPLVALTMCKEILAPLSLVLLIGFGAHLRRRGAVGKAALAVMTLATVVQLHRCYLAVFQPYASGGTGVEREGLLDSVLPSLAWATKSLLLLPSTTLGTSILLGVLILAGAVGTARRLAGKVSRDLAFVLLASLLVVLGAALVSPYRALRYLYPAAVLLAPLLAWGYTVLLEDKAAWLRQTANVFLFVTMAVFGGSVVLAQAVALKTSSRADWAFLDHLAGRHAAGHDVVLVVDGGTERAHWIECELKGIQLTGHVELTLPGYFHVVSSFEEASTARSGSVVAPGDPPRRETLLAADRAGFVPARTFDFREDAGTAWLLSRIRVVAKWLNPAFSYVKDAGSPRYPGHRWVTYER
ncbi:MAG: hypothetical protein ACYS99_11060 [Planctomycetota bacterium]